MTEGNDQRLLVARPGASLEGLDTPRAAEVAAEVARLDALVAGQAAALLEFFDAPAAFRAALKALA